jgi:hypothetical protein
VRRLPLGFPFTSLGFGLHDGHACTVHFDVHDGNILRGYFRKIQLNGAFDVGLLAFCDVLANRFGLPLHGLGCDLQARQLV